LQILTTLHQGFLWVLQLELEEEVRDRTVLILQFPDLFSLMKPDVRVAPLNRFPWSIVYTKTATEIIEFSYAHHNRKPEY
jgi:hypothetical protein